MQRDALNQQKLRIGKIPYANLFPIFYILENECDCSKYEFVEGVPSALNKMLRTGEVDVSPSSSIEYLRHSDEYAIVENHSISSTGTVGSIILLSRKPIEELNGLPVLTSSQSETSVVLLRIIFERFYKVKCDLKTADIHLDSLPSSAEAYLLIGDDALRAVKNKNAEFSYIYDLGELWHKHTGLPFTYALWIYKKDCCKEKAELLERFKSDLNRSNKRALENFKMIAAESPLKGILTENELISYWKQISYDFGDVHKKGLELFRKYSEELGLI